MSAQSNAPEGPGFTDRLGQRLRWAVIASVLINMGIWRAAAAIARRPAHFTPRPVEITRVILDKKGHKTPKVVTKKQVQKKVAHIKKVVQHRLNRATRATLVDRCARNRGCGSRRWASAAGCSGSWQASSLAPLYLACQRAYQPAAALARKNGELAARRALRQTRPPWSE